MRAINEGGKPESSWPAADGDGVALLVRHTADIAGIEHAGEVSEVIRDDMPKDGNVACSVDADLARCLISDEPSIRWDASRTQKPQFEEAAPPRKLLSREIFQLPSDWSASVMTVVKVVLRSMVKRYWR